MTELTPEQIGAIKKTLATAPKIQDDLKEELGYEKNIFFNLDLFEYRINNSCKDIAEDLDVKSRHGFKKNKTARGSVSYAFRGYDGAHFLEHEFGGLFGKVINDYIAGIRNKKNGLETADMINPETGVRYLVEAARIGGLIGGRATVETHGDQMRNGYANSLGNITPKKHSENSRKGARASALARGFHIWSLEEIADIGELKYGEGLTWNDTTSKMNEKYGGDWSTSKVRDAYRYNKDKLPDEEE